MGTAESLMRHPANEYVSDYFRVRPFLRRALPVTHALTRPSATLSQRERALDPLSLWSEGWGEGARSPAVIS